jgi:hypothetical protein
MQNKENTRIGAQAGTGANAKTDGEMMHKDTKIPVIPKDANLEQPPKTKKKNGLFLIRTANDCIEEAKKRPVPEMLFGAFWYEGELCILFADTNLGKSVLAVQIGDSISTGRAVPGFHMEASPQIVLYFDFELGDKQFEARYSVNFQNHYVFSERFSRAEIDPDAVLPDAFTNDFEAFLNHSLERAIQETSATVLIIDNITYLKNETEKAKDALPLMKHLKALKSKYRLSILALAHTPKRDLSKPITRNDLQGSKMLINFCDSAFAIGESHTDKSLRYLKQIKARNTEILYDGENVVNCLISKPANFLQFEFLNFGAEREHLRTPTEKEKSELEEQVKDELDKDPTISAYAIAQRLCTDQANFNSFKVKVTRIVNRLKKAKEQGD